MTNEKPSIAGEMPVGSWKMATFLVAIAAVTSLSIGLFGSDNGTPWCVTALLLIPPLVVSAWYATGRRAPKWLEVVLCVAAVPYGLAAMLLSVYALGAAVTFITG